MTTRYDARPESADLHTEDAKQSIRNALQHLTTSLPEDAEVWEFINPVALNIAHGELAAAISELQQLQARIVRALTEQTFED